jgi:hypothetical protein
LPQQCNKSTNVPIYKEGKKTDCSNYRGISLSQAIHKSLCNILVSSLIPYVDKIIGDHQCGVQGNRSTTSQTFCIHQILEKKWEYNGIVCQSY